MAEAVALGLLLRRRDQAVASALDAGLSPVIAADRIEDAVRAGIADARVAARAAGIARLEAEAESFGLDLPSGGILYGELARDIIRARVTSESYAQRWLRYAQGETPADAVRAASAGTAGSLRRISVSETSEAYSSGRAKYLQTVPAYRLVRRWDAQLDACPICSLEDGALVGAHENFPAGEPGSVHPFCNCTWTLLTLEEARAEAA